MFEATSGGGRGSTGVVSGLQQNPRAKGLAVAAVIVMIVGLVSAFAKNGAPSNHTITGAITVFDNGSCDFSYGYSDIAAGTDVVITNDVGRTVAIGHLDEGMSDGLGCEFAFTVPDVPDSPNYGVTISHRGTQYFTRSDMNENDWDVQLSLGE